MRYFNYELKPFRTIVLIIFSDTVTEGLNWIVNEHKGDLVGVDPERETETLGIVGSGLDKNGLKSWYIVFNENTITNGIIAHESFHAVSRISRQKGLKLGNDSEEFFAYAIEDLVTTINEQYDELQ